MIKGCQKRVIVVKHPDTDAFDEAYFIVSEGKYMKKSDKRTLIGEADRIIKSAGERKNKRFSSRFTLFLSFVAGVLCTICFFWALQVI